MSYGSKLFMITVCLCFFIVSPLSISVSFIQAEEIQNKTATASFQTLQMVGIPSGDFVNARIEWFDQKHFFDHEMKLIHSMVITNEYIDPDTSSLQTIQTELGTQNQVMIRIILQNFQEFTFGNIDPNQSILINLQSKKVTVLPTSATKKPNIIFILTDDLDEKLGTMMYTPKIDRYIRQAGITWENFFVTDTLCCPSRATISRGQFVHNHGVLTNGLPGGGYDTFFSRGNEDSTFATWLQEVGYETGFFGKYLNGYPFKDDPLHIPPGWNTWHSPSSGNPYSDYNYVMNENGKAVIYGHQSKDYLTDVIRNSSIEFIKQAKASGKPFLVYLSPYIPHSPATPAPRHSKLFPGLTTPYIGSFNEEDVSDKSSFLQSRKKLTNVQIKEMDKLFRKRIQSMQAVDEMVEKIVFTLQELGELDNTYLFFTSDNGFHMGQHRMSAGKGTAYEEDINVPLYVRGPGIPKGKVISGYLGGNTDFAPTFAEIAGAHIPSYVDGRSLLPLLHEDSPPPSWRSVFFIEFYPFARGRGEKPGSLKNVESVLEPLDLDELQAEAENFSYLALRFPDSKYIEYKNGEKEFYDLLKDPYEMENIIQTLDSKSIESMSRLANSLHQAKEEEFREIEELKLKK